MSTKKATRTTKGTRMKQASPEQFVDQVANDVLGVMKRRARKDGDFPIEYAIAALSRTLALLLGRTDDAVKASRRYALFHALFAEDFAMIEGIPPEDVAAALQGAFDAEDLLSPMKPGTVH